MQWSNIVGQYILVHVHVLVLLTLTAKSQTERSCESFSENIVTLYIQTKSNWCKNL